MLGEANLLASQLAAELFTCIPADRAALALAMRADDCKACEWAELALVINAEEWTAARDFLSLSNWASRTPSSSAS